MQHFDDPWSCEPSWRVPDPCVVVTLPGGIELAADPAGGRSEYTLGTWDGWANGPELRGGSEPWDNADGGVWGDLHFSGLNLQFEGMIEGRSANDYADLQAALGSILTNPRRGVMRVDEEHLGLSRQIEVARGGRPTITQLTERIGRYSVQFQSASPLKLDVDAQAATITAAGVPLRNIGGADAALSMTLTGPLTNPGITWSGGAWSYGGTLAAGKRLFVDLERRTVRDPDTTTHSRDKLLGLGAGSWPTLIPGTTTFWRTGTGSGSISMSWRSSWL